MFNKNSRGFTLLEILLVVGIIAILAGIVIIAINPSKQLASARNTQRISDLRQVYNAMEQYYIDHNVYPATLPSSLTEICDTGTVSATTTAVDGTPCGTLINLSLLVPTYMVAIPKDPQGPIAFLDKLITPVFAAVGGNGYQVMADANNKIALMAPKAELSATLTIGPVVITTATTTVASSCDATCLSLRSGLIAYYPLDTDLNDYSGNSYNGTNAGASVVSGVSSSTGGAYSFNGSSSYIDLGDRDAFSYTNGSGTDLPVTLSAWIKLSSLTGNGGIITKTNYTNYSNLEYRLEYVSSGVNNGISMEFTSVGNKVIGRYNLGNTFQVGQWYLITATYDGSKSTSGVKIYSNGNRIDTTNNIYDSYVGMSNTVTPLKIGSETNSGAVFNGSIDEVSIWNRVLSAQEIVDLWNTGIGKSLMLGGSYSVIYNGNGSDGGSVPTDSNTYVGASTITVNSAGSMTKSGYTFAGWNIQQDGMGINYQSGDTFTLGSSNITLYAKWNSNSCDATCQSLRSGLVAYYPLNTDVNDYSGNSYNGTNIGATPTSGKVGGADIFNGSTNYINVNPVISSGVFSGNHTFSAWVKLNSWSASQVVFAAGKTSAMQWYSEMDFQSTPKKFTARTAAGVGPENVVTSINTYNNDSGWHYLVMEVNGTGHIVNFYIDGVSQGSSSTNNFNLSSMDKAYIGQLPWTTANAVPFNGIIDEVAVWNRILTTQEITNLINVGTGKSLMP